MEWGQAAIPLIDQARARAIESDEKAKLGEILLELTYPTLLDEFSELFHQGIHEIRQLEQAVLLLSRLDQPTFRTKWISTKLDEMADEIEPSILSADTSKDKMEILLRYVFEELNFKGDRQEYHALENSLLHEVMDHRKGIPLTLSLIVLFLADRLQLPFYGVNMPIHFLLLFDPKGSRIYIDPFDDGAVVSREQCLIFMKHNEIPPRPEYFEPCLPIEILRRHLRNLMNSYEKEGDRERSEKVNQLLRITEN
jgi:regulator of sirC expression with transglutaminase-like and TPR domain